ncbi:hypothetical protein K8I31_17695 [bacterium]|nr:hypothetical protein [bacterium]
MSYFIGQALALFVPSLSLGVCLFLAGTLMDSRDEEDHRGFMGNLIGAAGVMAGALILIFISQWVPVVRYLMTPAFWVLIFVCFRLGSLLEMIVMCLLCTIILNMTIIMFASA